MKREIRIAKNVAKSIDSYPKKGKLFKDLEKGLKEAIAHEKGQIHLRTISIELPEPPTEYKPKDIKSVFS